MIQRLLIAFLALAPACAPACAPTGSGEPHPRNVVVVVLDSVRADHLGVYGYERPTTPQLDALGAKGIVFERAYAGSSAAPQSLSTLWTGRLPSSGGSIGLREATPHPELLTLPRLFLRAGFTTGLVSNRGGLRERAFTRGFDDVEVDSQPGRWPGSLVTEKALELVDRAAGVSLMLVVDYADAAAPHLPSAEYRERIDVPRQDRLLSLPNLRGGAGSLPAGIENTPAFHDLLARYDAELAYVDECLGQLVDGLRGRGLMHDTLLIVTSSQGVEFLEHDYVGSAWTLYEETIRVPLILHAPGRLAPRRVVDPVSLADVVPTLQAMFGLQERDQLDGRSLLESTPEREIVAEVIIPELGISRACIQGDWKLIEGIVVVPPGERLERMEAYDETIVKMQDGELPRPDPWGTPVRRELYDLGADPGEQRDVADQAADRVALLSALLERYAAFCARSGLAGRAAARRAELAEELGELQQLGYL